MRSNRRSRTDSYGRKGRHEWPAERTSPGHATGFIRFLLQSKRWWLTPMIIVLLLLSLMAAMSGAGAAPFIYVLD